MPFGIMSDVSRDEACSGVWGSAHGNGHFWGANLGRAIVTNGDLLSQRRGPLPKLLWADLFDYRTRKHRSGYLHRRQVVIFRRRNSKCDAVTTTAWWSGAHNGQLIYEAIMAAAATLKEQRPFISAVFPATLSARHSHRLPRPVAQRTKRD